MNQPADASEGVLDQGAIIRDRYQLLAELAEELETVFPEIGDAKLDIRFSKENPAPKGFN